MYTHELTSKLLIEAFNHIQAAMQIFEANDPNFERSFEVNNNISVAYKCYREIHENRKKEAKQMRLEHFFTKKNVNVLFMCLNYYNRILFSS